MSSIEVEARIRAAIRPQLDQLSNLEKQYKLEAWQIKQTYNPDPPAPHPAKTLGEIVGSMQRALNDAMQAFAIGINKGLNSTRSDYTTTD